MNFGFAKEEMEFKEEIRTFLESNIDEQVEKESRHWVAASPGGPYTKDLLMKMGERGWLTPSWPKEYGGLGLSPIYQYIVVEEMDYAGIWAPLGSTIMGPTIMKYGSEEMKRKYLPKIAKGQIYFALGYTEPNAGSDLSNVKMRAERKDNNYIINGAKLFNTHCHLSDYHWLLAVTNREAKPSYKGMSLFIVDLKSPGIIVNALWSMADERTNEVFYDNVKVPAANRVGDENRGFYYLMEDLEYERTFTAGGVQRMFEDLLSYIETAHDGRLKSDPIVRYNVAKLATEIEVGRLLYWKTGCLLNKGRSLSFESSMVKVFISELMQNLSEFALKITGLQGQLKEGSPWAVLSGKAELRARQSVVQTIWGGTNEICRNVIANRALGVK